MTGHHIVAPRTYLIVFTALIVFTLLTVGIDLLDRAGTFHLPRLLHSVISLAIAVVKAALVVLFFMHVWYSRWLNWIVAAGSLLWLAILIGYTVTDYLSREWIHVPGH